MANFEERIYELSTEALAEQERQIAHIRSRASTLVATGAVVASLLAKPIFHNGHPVGAGEISATTVGLIGAGSLLLFVALLLRPYEMGFSVNSSATYRALWAQGIVEQPMVDIALAEAFEEQRQQNAHIRKRLVRCLGFALVALLAETAGLAAAAALAS